MATPILMPKLGLTMEIGMVVSWRRKEGERVEKGETVLEVETDKIVTDVPSPQSGTVLKVIVPEGSEARVQAVLAIVGDPGEDISAFLAAPPDAGAPGTGEPGTGATWAPGLAVTTEEERAAAESGGGRLRITPRARKLLTEKGFSPADLEGLGKARISEADVQEFLDSRGSAHAPAPSHSTAAPSPGVPGQVKQMGRIEKIVAARMTESFRDIPQFSLRMVAEVDLLLGRLPRMREETGAQISINDLVLRAAAIALSRFPDVQCQFRPEGIFVPAAVNLGFAVALGRDLVVAVIRNADKKRIGEISSEAAHLAERAKARRLCPEDLSGGTFTVSNLGMFGVSSFVPIVNPGEGAILGVGAVHDVARIRDGTVAAGRAIECTLVCDHRSVNGATGAEFCKGLKQVLESPEREAW
jgi:pyruvate dehydrogenase E2 component (dihydrolipoamide acetyltransferase)